MPKARMFHSTVYFQGRIYVAGGSHPKTRELTSAMWSYDPRTKMWYTEKCMPQARQHFGFVVAHLQIYAIGGQDQRGNAVASVLCYDPVNAVWNSVKPMNVARSGAAVAKYKSAIWVAGGETNGHVITKSVEHFNLLANVWQFFKFDLRIPRCFSRMVVVNDLFYIVGGACRLNDRNEYEADASIGNIYLVVMQEFSNNCC